MLLPTEIVQIPEQYEGKESREVLNTAGRLTDQLVNSQTYDRYIIDALVELSAEHPYVVEAVIDRLVDHVLQGTDLDANARVYRHGVAHLALDLATSVPDTADRTIELIQTIDELEMDEYVLDEFFLQMSERNTTVLVEILDILLKPDDVYSHVRPERGRALVRGVQTDPALLDEPIQELRSDFPSKRSLEQLGNIGLVVPEGVEPTVPEIIEATTADDAAVRAAAIEALGLIGGTTSRTEDRYGNPLSSSTAIFEALESGLDDTSQDVSEAAANALVRAVAEDDRLRERAIDALLQTVETLDSRTDRYGTVLCAVDSLADESQLPEQAAASLIEGLGNTDTPETIEDILKLLGQVNATETHQERIEHELIDGLKTDDRHIQQGAAMGAGAWLAHRSSVADGLVAALAEVTTSDAYSIRDDAFKALGKADRRDRILDAIEGGIGQYRNGQAVGEAIVALEADSVVESVLDRFEAICLQCSTEPEVETSSSAFSKEQTALTNTLNTIASTAPKMLTPHTDRLVNVVTEDPGGCEKLSASVANAFSALTEVSPESVRPHLSVLRDCLLSNPDRPGAGKLLNVLLISSAAEPMVIDSVAETISGQALSPALCRLSYEDPVTVLRAISEFAVEIWFDDDHMHVGGWLHAIDELGTADVRVHGPTLDLYAHALTADDHWVQVDGGADLAITANSYSQRVDRFSPLFARELAGNSDYVTTWLLRSLGWTGTNATNATVDAYRSHPGSASREAAEEASRRLTGDEPDSSDAESSLDKVETAMWRVTLSNGPIPATVSSDGDSRSKFFAVLFASLQHPDDRVRTRARATVREITEEGDLPNTSELNDEAIDDLRVLGPFFTDDDPVVRALAVYTAGSAAGTHDDHVIAAVIDRLKPALQDKEFVVQRWAIRALGVYAQQCPDAVGKVVPTLTALLDRVDSTTRTYIVRTLASLADEDPALVEPAADALVQTLDDSNEATQFGALNALVRLSPSTLVSHPRVVTKALSAAEHGNPSINQLGADLIAVVSEGDPDILRNHVEEIVDSYGGNSIRRALANIASESPELVTPYADTLADGTNDIHTRKTLVSVRSSRYLDLLERFLQDYPSRLQNELDLFVEFIISVPDLETRQRAIEIMVTETAGTSSLLDWTRRALTVGLTTDDPTVRQHAAEAVSSTVEKQDIESSHLVLDDTVIPTLITWAGDDQWSVRSQAVQTLTTIVDISPESISDETYQEIVSLGLERLGDEHGWTRRHAADLLGTLPSEVREQYRVLDYLGNCSAAETDTELFIRGETLAIGTIAAADRRYDRALKELIERTTHEDQWVRRNAVESLAMIGAIEGFDPDRDLPTESDIDVDRVRAAIREALTDSDPTVRAQACRCMGFWGTIDDLELLEELITDPQSEIRSEASRAHTRLRNNQ